MFALNPNVLYLQSTPMTEPLLLALTTLAVALLMAWCDSATVSARLREPTDSAVPTSVGLHVGWAFALACLTRYEAWPVTVERARRRRVGALARAVSRSRRCARDVGAIAVYPAVAVAGFASSAAS